ncbi:MAG TPA: pectate lyase [Sphingomonas sp.]|nr:pectate lyase [Sphingomonas sp.]
MIDMRSTLPLRLRLVAMAGAVALAVPVQAQTAPPATNIDEAKAGDYVLPDPLRLNDSRPVPDAASWMRARRPELLALFAAHQFGETPATAVRPRVETVERDGRGLGGLAMRTQVRLVVGEAKIRVVLYVPAAATGPVPVLLHIGFSPNALVFEEPGLDTGMAWNVRTKARVPDREATLLAGFDAKPFIDKGFAVAHVYYGDIEPDFDGGAKFGVRAAISRRNFGETIADIASPTRYHYWFAPRYASYAANVTRLPVDAHMLLALIAPRPMLLVNGDEDTWSDWKGEQVAADAARPVYRLFGRPDDLAVFTHKGGHKLLPEDLTAMAAFMTRHFGAPRIAAANAARRINPNRPVAWWPAMATKPDGWFAGDEARTIAGNILSWQDPAAGGWPLMNTTREPNRGDPAQAGPWGKRAALIKATVNEMRFLARAHAAKPDPRYLSAIDRGLGYILGAQYPAGGFPHSWPVFTNAYDHQATFNDDEMVDLMDLLHDVATVSEFRVLPAARRAAAQAAFDRGIGFILKTQIRANGTLTGWAQQYDEKTLEPRGARAFEPVAISGGESANVLSLLMRIERPDAQVKAAIEAGVAWYRKTAITGIRVETTDADRIVHTDPSASPVWARYYQIGTDRPIFVGRDGVIRYALAEVEQERRGGYAWYGDWGAAVLTRHAEWIKRHR